MCGLIFSLGLCGEISAHLIPGTAQHKTLEQFSENCSRINLVRQLGSYNNTYFSEHFWVRPIFPQDANAFYMTMAHPEHMSLLWYGKVYGSQEVDKIFAEWAKASVNQKHDEYFVTWVVITRLGIGGLVMHHTPKNPLDVSLGRIEITALVNKDFSGCGLAGRSLEFLMQQKHDENVQHMATAHPQNKASIKMLTRLGLKPDPNRQNIPFYNSVRNFYV